MQVSTHVGAHLAWRDTLSNTLSIDHKKVWVTVDCRGMKVGDGGKFGWDGINNVEFGRASARGMRRLGQIKWRSLWKSAQHTEQSNKKTTDCLIPTAHYILNILPRTVLRASASISFSVKRKLNNKKTMGKHTHCLGTIILR